jgi:hypothetical protein
MSNITAVCPKNPAHQRFVTTAHVMEDWVVDQNGSFKESLGSIQTTHWPDVGNIWTCHECGAEATVEYD